MSTKAGKVQTIAVLLIIFDIALLITPGQSVANPTGSVNYNQCMLTATNEAVGDMATRKAVSSCREKFPGKVPEDENLTTEALGRLDTDGGFGYGIFSGSIYNGNSDYTVTQVTIILTPILAELPLITREYNIDVTVQPFSKSALSVSLISDSIRELSWSLTKARGYKVR